MKQKEWGFLPSVDWSGVRSAVLSEEKCWIKTACCFLNNERSSCFTRLLGHFLFTGNKEMQTQAYTHFEYDWIFLLFSSLHVAKSHEWNILIWFLTRGLCLVFFVVGDIVLHVFSIVQVQARDLGGTSGMTGLSIILLSDYFTFFFFLLQLEKQHSSFFWPIRSWQKVCLWKVKQKIHF